MPDSPVDRRLTRAGAGSHGARSFALLALLVFPGMWTQAARAAVHRSQAVATLHRAHQAYARPTGTSARIKLIQARRPITGERTVLPVIGATTRWLHVRLPGRPNGVTGWIRKAETAVATTRWHVVVELGLRRVVVYRAGRQVLIARAVVGKPSTPTPRGEYFVEEDVRLRPADVGAPFALALSARSTVLQEFDGGPGQIALHGLANVGGTLGTAASHGCIRLDSTTMHWLVVHIGPGVPVTISK
jgi:lipoprotein-anchoring transpeptidase ErfK/SrfK